MLITQVRVISFSAATPKEAWEILVAVDEEIFKLLNGLNAETLSSNTKIEHEK